MEILDFALRKGQARTFCFKIDFGIELLLFTTFMLLLCLILEAGS